MKNFLANPNVRLVVHLLAQIVAQTAVANLVPSNYEPLYAALVAIVGVFVAFVDQTVSVSK